MGASCEKELEDELKQHGESREDIVGRDPDEPWANFKPDGGGFVGYAWTSKRVYFTSMSPRKMTVGSVPRNPPTQPSTEPDSGPRERKRKRANKSTL